MMKIKKGDTVKVIAGKDKDKEGKVLAVKDGKVLVENVNMVTKHTKPSVSNQNGGIVHQESPIEASNVMYVHNGKVTTFPVEGSRPRGKNEEEDRRLEKELLQDEKELSEHNMLVDLGRNDLGKICRFGSVKVTEYMAVHKYSKIMHICSQVEGVIREDKDALDDIEAVLPAGTLSGAPKIRACQIIEELEKEERGIYGGALGYLDFTGNMDTCIAIRMAVKKDQKVYVQAGGGIVADSIPEKEYEESANKAAAVIQAIIQAEEEGI